MTGKAKSFMMRTVVLPALLFFVNGVAAKSEKLPPLPYQPVPGFLSLPPGLYFGETSGVALNSRGHIFVFHRGSPSLVEFDSEGHFIRAIGEGLFTKSHGLRIDAEDNIWTTDVGAHTVLKFSPQGQLLIVLGRKNMAGEWHDADNYPLFDRPSDIAFGKDGEIYVSDGYGNSRIMKLHRENSTCPTRLLSMPPAVFTCATGQTGGCRFLIQRETLLKNGPTSALPTAFASLKKTFSLWPME